METNTHVAGDDRRPTGFAVIGLEHPHAYAATLSLLAAGAELVGLHCDDEQAAAGFLSVFDGARRAGTVDEILDDDSVDFVTLVGVPSDRARVAIRAMRAGKDVLADKPAVTTLAQLADLRDAQAATGRILSVYLSERLEDRASNKVGELISRGTIGDVVQIVGFGPHQLNIDARPDWFFDEAHSAGILGDLATHQIDQFLHYAGVRDLDTTPVEIVSSTVANHAHPERPNFQDFGEIHLRTATTTGFARVDWFSPSGLTTWGDVRLFLLGTHGSIELRKNIDLAGRAGGDHLFLVDNEGTHYVDCSDVDLPFARRFLDDVSNRTETHMPQAHAFAVCDLALRAQGSARRLGTHADVSPPRRG